jgi:hypothetical protein
LHFCNFQLLIAQRSPVQPSARLGDIMGVIGWVWNAVFAVLLCLWRWFRVLWVCRVSAVSAIGGGLLAVYTPQALDLFADTGLSFAKWVAFFGLLFAWAWVVHTMARRALQYDDWLCEGRWGERFTDARRSALREEFYWPALCIPRVLGIAVFAFIAWALFAARSNLQTAAKGMLPEAVSASRLILVLFIITLLLGAVYFIAVWGRRRVVASLTGHRREPPLLAGKVPLLALLLEPTKHPWALFWAATRPQKWLVVAWIVVLAIFIFSLVNPAFVADWLPRALFLPVLTGAGVLLLGEVAALSHRWETPLLLVLAVAGGLSAWLLGHYNDVRWAKQPAQSNVVGASLEISFADALARWKYANNCDQGQTCRDPIVIAGAGGASRAAFQTATVAGALIDLGLKEPGTYGNLRNRIFALSTVSGSSVGAVVMRAALTDAAENGMPDKPPCQNAVSGAWFGSAANRGENSSFNAKESWRDCFQQLLAGDFLSAVAVGLAYRDNFPLGNPFTGRAFWSDRAVLLEQAFERRYFDVTGKGAVACTDAKTNGLCRRFGHHPDPKTAGAWLPLLFINGSSVSTGRRILTSDVSAGDLVANNPTDQTKTSPLIELGYDMRELRTSAHNNVPKDNNEAATDMFLSSAATTSCRFPVISPQGIIRDQNAEIVDAIVDGGYFENDGLDTATDVVRALQNAGLHPIVLRIVNEPFVPTADDRKLNRPGPDLPKDSERALFDVYTSIARGLLATRSGHEDEEAYYLNTALDPDSFIEIGVRPMKKTDTPVCRSTNTAEASMKIVSMSWWMSQSVQAYLDGQLCVPENWTKLGCALKARDLAARQACASPPLR